MNRIYNLVTILVVLSVLLSCTKQREESQKIIEIKNYLTNDLDVNDIESRKLYLFIPDDTCSSCRMGLINFYNDLTVKAKNHIAYVFVSYSTKKTEFLMENINDKNSIIVDVKGMAYKKHLISPSMPTLLITNKESSKTITFQSGEYIEIVEEMKHFLNEN